MGITSFMMMMEMMRKMTICNSVTRERERDGWFEQGDKVVTL